MKLQFVILSRDRPEFLKQAIDSVLAQNEPLVEFELIVSDNSENENVAKMIEKNYEIDSFKVITRTPTLSSRDHFQLVVSELTSEYTVLFHDDDVLHPDYIKTMCAFLENTNEIVSAVGCNAFIFRKNIKKCADKMHSFRVVKSFNKRRDFLSQYLFGNGGKAPFPSYMYNTKFLKEVSINELPCGKHGDVTLLSTLLDYGEIFWVPDVLMYSRLHNLNDNNVYNLANRICLLNFMVKNGLSRNDDLIVLLRCDYWYKWFIGQKIRNIFFWRNKIVFKFLFFKFFNLMYKVNFWKGIFARIKRDFLV